jgi:hypothetical protein
MPPGRAGVDVRVVVDLHHVAALAGLLEVDAVEAVANQVRHAQGLVHHHLRRLPHRQRDGATLDV